MLTVILATGNAHKVQEIRAMLGGGFHYRTLRDFPTAPVAVEDGRTFAENAEKKARSLARWLTETNAIPDPEFAVLADDSGLEVDALGGAPGVHSARFAALDDGRPGNSPDAENNAKLMRLLASVPPARRTARFHCTLAWGRFNRDATTHADHLDVSIFDGACEGQIAMAPSGAAGFGYDPLFVPVGFRLSFAELGDEVKNQLSHRSRALAALRKRLAQSVGASGRVQVSP